MDQVSSTIYPKRDIRELNLTYKGKDMSEKMKTLKQVMGTSFGKVDSIIMILSSKSAIEMEYMDQELAIFGSKIETNQFDPKVMAEKVAELKMFLCETSASDQIIELALKKCNLDLESAIGMVITDEGIADLEAELVRDQIEKQEESNMMLVAKEAERPADSNAEEDEQILEDKLNLIVSNKAEYFDLLFELLNLGVPDITQAVWKLMMQVPVNKKLYNNMRSLDSIQPGSSIKDSMSLSEDPYEAGEEAFIVQWQAMVDPSQPYKMLYSLQILNTLVSVNNQVLSDVEVQERYDWRQKFLELGGFTHLYWVLIRTDVNELTKLYNSSSQIEPLSAAASKKVKDLP